MKYECISVCKYGMELYCKIFTKSLIFLLHTVKRDILKCLRFFFLPIFNAFYAQYFRMSNAISFIHDFFSPQRFLIFKIFLFCFVCL